MTKYAIIKYVVGGLTPMKQIAVEAVGHLPFLKIKKAPYEGARSCLLNS